MKVFIDGEEYQGTPEEIHAFITLQEKSGQLIDVNQEELIPEPSFIHDDFEPLEDIVNDSVKLRAKLAQDPAYNPYGGVVTSHETVADIDAKKSPVTAEQDTGVILR